MEDFYARVLGFAVTDRGELATPTGRVSLPGSRTRATWSAEFAQRIAPRHG